MYLPVKAARKRNTFLRASVKIFARKRNAPHVCVLGVSILPLSIFRLGFGPVSDDSGILELFLTTMWYFRTVSDDSVVF